MNRILESAQNDDWRTLKAIFESARVDKSITDGIRQAKNIDDLVAWFAEAYRHQLGTHGRISATIQAKADAEKIKEALAVYNNPEAGIEDKLDAVEYINGYARKVGDLFSMARIMATGSDHLDRVDSPMSAQEYADHKLSQVKEAAKAFMAGFESQEERAREARTRRAQDLAEADAAVKEMSDKYSAATEEARVRRGWKEALAKVDAIVTDHKGRIATEIEANVGREDHYALIEKRAAIDEEYNRVMAEVQTEMRRIMDEANAETDGLRKEYNVIAERFNEREAANIERIKEAQEELYEAVTGKIMVNSPVDMEAAQKWFDSLVMLDKRTQAALKYRKYDLDLFKEDMLEFYMLTGGRLPRITFDIKGGQRAAANVKNGVVYISGNFGKETLFHELAHVLEDDQRTTAISNRFLDHRTGRHNGVTVKRLKDIHHKGYQAHEVAWEDTFIHPYVGKSYRDGITEVFSMGIQYFSSPAAMMELREKDPEHFEIMLGYMLEKPRLSKDKVEKQQQAQIEKKGDAETSEDLLKTIDKKVAAAGEFWTEAGLHYEAYFPTKAVWDEETYRWDKTVTSKRPRYVMVGVKSEREGRTWIENSIYFKSEKAAKRAMWLFLTNGRPSSGKFSLMELKYSLQGKGPLPKDILEMKESIASGGLP